MVRHLTKLVWNRKRANGLLLLEIFFTFLVLFAVSVAALDLTGKLGSAPGHTTDRVWALEMTSYGASDDAWTPEQVAATAQLLREVQAIPGVEAAALAFSTPYDIGAWESVFGHPERPGEDLVVEVNQVSDDFARLVGLELTAGRFFEPADDALGFEPVVIDQDLALARFGDRDPIGQTFDSDGKQRVVGVVRDYRRSELSARGNYLFQRLRVGNPEDRPPSRILLRMAPGIDASFEEGLIRQLHGVAPQWSYEVRPLAALRADFLRLNMAPILTGGLVAGFLLLMVALGLTGVLWQSLSQRTREIGLRRAVGASAGAIRGQLLGEMLVLAGFALALGALLVLQVPMLLPVLGWGEVVPALFVACLAILALVTAAGWLPARLASRLEPAEALRYE